jgi:uncharacterized protein (TIGR02001 family)
VTRKSGWLVGLAIISAQTHADAIVTGTLGATSDLVIRGLSLTRGRPAAQASIDLEFPSDLYVGAFVATTDPNRGPSPNFEMDAWIGRYWSLSENVSADLRLSRYVYPDDPRRVTYDRTELTATVGFRNQVFFAAIYSPDTAAVGSSPGYHGSEAAAWALELSGRRPLNERWALSAGVGHYDLQQVYDDSYTYWNATVTATLAAFELQVAYLGVSSAAERHFAARSVGDRIAVTALWRFSSAP